MALLSDPATYQLHPESSWKRRKVRHAKPRFLAGLEQGINPYFGLNHRGFGHATAAEVADDFANDAGVATDDEALCLRPALADYGRGVVELQLGLEGGEVGTLSGNEFAPFATRCAGSQARSDSLSRGGEVGGLAGLHQQ